MVRVIALALTCLVCRFPQAIAESAVVTIPAEGVSLSPDGIAPVTVADLIELTRFAPGAYGWFRPARFVWSPDRSQLAVLVCRGNLARNTRDYEILLFRARDLGGKTPPRVLAAFASSSNRPAVNGIKWLADNATLAFIAENSGVLPQVYTLDVRSGTLNQLTRATTMIRSFDISARGESLIYTIERPPEPVDDRMMRARGFVLPPDAYLPNVLAGKYRNMDEGLIESWDAIAEPLEGPLELRWRRRDGLDEPLNVAGSAPQCFSFSLGNAQLSPRGDVALIPCTPRAAPKAWHDYASSAAPYGLPQQWRQWMLIELAAMKSRPLNGTPLLFPSNWYPGEPLIWTGSGQSVILFDALLPLEGHTGQERAKRASHRVIAEVDIRNGRTSVAGLFGGTIYEPTVAEWHSVEGGAVLEVQVSGERAFFQKTGSAWRRLASPPSEVGESLAIDMGINSPWKLVALHPVTGERRLIYDPNPNLFGKHAFGRVTELRWTYGKPEKTSEATLYWPPSYRAGERHPLVIQGHGRSLTDFWPEGQAITRQAAQPLSGAGIFVVQLAEGGPGWDQVDFTTYRETLFAQIEGLIDLLDRSGLIDRARVGVAGVSTDFGAFIHFMAHSDYPVAAAALAEGVEFSYFTYVATGIGHPWQSIWTDVNGGLPWGPARRSWLDRAPGFNLERVTAAIQFEASGDGLNGHILGMWEIYQGMRLLGRPVEIVLQPDAVHVRYKSWDCLTSQQGMVDWMRFWLQGHERTEPVAIAGETLEDLSGKYSRWRAMRTSKDLE